TVDSTRTRYASLQPVFTPSNGRPNDEPLKGAAGRPTYWNALRTGPGNRSHGLPAVPSIDNRCAGQRQLRVAPAAHTVILIWSSGRSAVVAGSAGSLELSARRRATNSEGYTAASKCEGEPARSSISKMSARSRRSSRTPPPASDRHSLH